MILRGLLTGIALASCIQPLIASEAGPALASRQQIEIGLCLLISYDISIWARRYV